MRVTKSLSRVVLGVALWVFLVLVLILSPVSLLPVIVAWILAVPVFIMIYDGKTIQATNFVIEMSNWATDTVKVLLCLEEG